MRQVACGEHSMVGCVRCVVGGGWRVAGGRCRTVAEIITSVDMVV